VTYARGVRPRVTEIVRGCYSAVEVLGRDGYPGIGITNLKRIFGRPAELRAVVDAITATIGDARAIASADTGSAPLAALVAYELGLPAVFVRDAPKRHFLSYGGDPETNHVRLAGERLEPDTTVHLIDDMVHTGATLASAARVLHEAALVARTASCVLISPPSAGWPDATAKAGIERIDALTTTIDLG
jgi:adenine/guanine phosphoribosyltransferase-like PRPP-binding protein